MANTGHSSRDPFSGYITHRDSSGKKTGTSKPNWGGGYTNYDAKGHKVGESKRNWAGGLDHYDAKGHKIGESKRNFADGLDHYDAKGKKTGTSYRNFANGYDNYDEDGCYIATCVYGSYDCPEVWTLRRFRDDTLAKSDAGENKLLRYVLAHANPKAIKRAGALLLGGGVAVSLVGKWVRNRAYRAAMARELKKQLAPVNKKLDELEKQNEELKKQNEQLRKQLR